MTISGKAKSRFGALLGGKKSKPSPKKVAAKAKPKVEEDAYADIEDELEDELEDEELEDEEELEEEQDLEEDDDEESEDDDDSDDDEDDEPVDDPEAALNAAYDAHRNQSDVAAVMEGTIRLIEVIAQHKKDIIKALRIAIDS